MRAQGGEDMTTDEQDPSLAVLSQEQDQNQSLVLEEGCMAELKGHSCDLLQVHHPKD